MIRSLWSNSCAISFTVKQLIDKETHHISTRPVNIFTELFELVHVLRYFGHKQLVNISAQLTWKQTESNLSAQLQQQPVKTGNLPFTPSTRQAARTCSHTKRLARCFIAASVRFWRDGTEGPWRGQRFTGLAAADARACCAALNSQAAGGAQEHVRLSSQPIAAWLFNCNSAPLRPLFLWQRKSVKKK